MYIKERILLKKESINSSKVYCKLGLQITATIQRIVLIVAKCIVNSLTSFDL